MRAIERLHAGYVHGRRVEVLQDALAGLIPTSASVLDVGTGDGLLASLIAARRPDLRVSGVDTLVRQDSRLDIAPFDGRALPFPDNGVDVVMFVDVLHHTDDPMVLLHESARVARQSVIIKDHMLQGFGARATLRFMDRVGNERFGVSLPYNYWTHAQWLRSFEQLGMTIGVWKTELGLYPRPAKWLFERSLHFVARLDVVR